MSKIRGSFTQRFGLVENLVVRDRTGQRTVTATTEEGVYQVDGLTAGIIDATYTLPLTSDCSRVSCRDENGGILVGADIALHPMGVDPDFHAPCRIEVDMPEMWTLVTAEGVTPPPPVVPVPIELAPLLVPTVPV